MPVTSEPSARRFRIAALLSKGSSGRVYRAVVEHPDGSELDVAIKLLGEEELRAVPLERLQAEARRVALVEDRAMVRVEPPIQLGDKWALVMDLVTGVSLQRLTSLGPMPVPVVAEIVQEVARVLHKVWAAAGPDGRPLRILHRDLKPSNLQLNAGGELRILDFGIAKADFRTRDAQTAAYATGTRAFVSPERVEGVDTPAGDVYSLGVTAHVLLGDDRGPTGSEDAATQAMVALITKMRSDDPKARPAAQEVERACASLRRRATGESLREWAERNVPRAIAVRFSDRVVGTVLTGAGPSLPADRRASAPPPTSRAPRSTPPAATPATARAVRSREPASPRAKEPSPTPAGRSRRSDPPSSPPARGARSVPPPSATPPTTAARSLGAHGPPERVARSSPPAPEPRSPQRAPRSPPRAPKSVPPASDGSRATPATVARNLPEGLGGAGDLTPGGVAQPRPRGRPAPSIAPAPLFPKKLHDAETVAAERSSFASLLDAEGDPRKSMSVGTETIAADPPRRVPRRVGRDAPARRGWLVGVLATGMLAMGLVGVLGLVAAASAWWMWPEERVPLEPAPIHVVDTRPGLMDDDEMVEMLSQAPLPPPDGLRVTFNSVPLGADVYIDGRRIGQTPLIGVKLNEGAHEVILVSDFERVARTIDVGERKPMRFVWRGGERWEEHGKR